MLSVKLYWNKFVNLSPLLSCSVAFLPFSFLSTTDRWDFRSIPAPLWPSLPSQPLVQTGNSHSRVHQQNGSGCVRLLFLAQAVSHFRRFHFIWEETLRKKIFSHITAALACTGTCWPGASTARAAPAGAFFSSVLLVCSLIVPLNHRSRIFVVLAALVAPKCRLSSFCSSLTPDSHQEKKE